MKTKKLPPNHRVMIFHRSTNTSERLIRRVIRAANKYHITHLNCKEACFEDYHIFILLHYKAYNKQPPKRLLNMKHLAVCVNHALSKLKDSEKKQLYEYIREVF